MSQWHPARCAVIGASGGLGAAFVDHLELRPKVENVWKLARSYKEVPPDEDDSRIYLDYFDPGSILLAADKVTKSAPLDLVIVATGLLHDETGVKPEKSLRELDADNLAKTYHMNAIGPALVMQSFLPLMRKDKKSVFAVLSARVGSISDNHLGGWYGYRAAKAALNQMIKTASIEQKRRHPDSVVVGLHPGTVDTGLSKPFQRNVEPAKLFTADYAAARLLKVVGELSPADSGSVFAYDGTRIPE